MSTNNSISNAFTHNKFGMVTNWDGTHNWKGYFSRCFPPVIHLTRNFTPTLLQFKNYRPFANSNHVRAGKGDISYSCVCLCNWQLVDIRGRATSSTNVTRVRCLSCVEIRYRRSRSWWFQTNVWKTHNVGNKVLVHYLTCVVYVDVQNVSYIPHKIT